MENSPQHSLEEEEEVAESVYVVKGQGDTALLSRGAAERMGLVEYHLDLTTNTPLPVMGETPQVTIDLVEEHWAPVAQLVQHQVLMREVVSSTPAGPTLRVLK